MFSILFNLKWFLILPWFHCSLNLSYHSRSFLDSLLSRSCHIFLGVFFFVPRSQYFIKVFSLLTITTILRHLCPHGHLEPGEDASIKLPLRVQQAAIISNLDQGGLRQLPLKGRLVPVGFSGILVTGVDVSDVSSSNIIKYYYLCTRIFQEH